MRLPRIPSLLPGISAEVSELIRSEADQHPNWADVQNRWGLLLLFQGNASDAVPVFARCLEINPNYAWAALNHVQAVALGGDPASTRRLLEAIPEPAPGARAAARVLLDLLDPRGESGDPFRDLPPALLERPDFVRLRGIHAGRPARPRDLRVLVPGLHQLFKEASTWEVRFGNADRARDLAASILAVWDDPGAYWCQEGLIASISGEEGDALEAYREAARMDPSSPEPLIALAYHWSALGEAEPAHTSLAEALRRAPGFADLQYQMGLLEAARGRLAPALDSFQAALALNPNYTVARLQEAEILARLGRWEDARESYVRVVDAGLQSTDLYIRLGQTEENLGRPVQAEEAYRAALRLNPEEPLVHLQLGHLHRSRGERDKAKKAWQRYLVLAGESDQADAIRAELQEDAGP